VTRRRLIGLLPLAAAVAPASGQAGFDFASHVGLAAVTADGAACLAMPASALAPGSAVVLVDDRDAGALLHAVVERVRDAPCGGDVEGGVTAYDARVRGDGLPPFAVLIAVAVRGAALAEGPGGVSGDLDGDGTRETFRSCTSAEGLHFTIWSGAPLTGRRRWHRYYYLGYDVEPSCTPAEYEP
jgi:hypothetical protein